MISCDILVIGAGVTGCAIARALSRYRAAVHVVEKGPDVCEGTSKANSAIIHAGHDAAPGSLKARLNARGNRMMDDIARELQVPFRRNGALVLCLSEADMPKLRALYDRGVQNGVEGLEIWDRDTLVQNEPQVSDRAVAALYAPTSGIVNPFELTLAFAENAAMNGAEFHFSFPVTAIRRENGGYVVEAGDERFACRAVVNAAGVYADAIHNMACADKMALTPRRGEYFLLDKTAGGHVTHTIFQLPGVYGKGVLVTPTIDGNLLVGPTSDDIDDKEATCTTGGGLAAVAEKSAMSVRDVPLRQVITAFSGLRAHHAGDDFVIGESEDGFFDAAGIESPGLSSAPAIGEMVAGMVAEKLALAADETYKPERKAIPVLHELPLAERLLLIEENPAYGAIVCRCEEISEGEILAAIHRPLGATTLDGVKRRVRAGAGRCQGGFCMPRVMELLAQAQGVSRMEIRKNGPGSQLVLERTRKGDAE